LNLAGINTDPQDVHEALASLAAVSERLRAEGDPRAIFPDIYSVITESVAREVWHDTGFFLEPGFISRLASRFAKRYLETLQRALEGQPQDCSAWALAYAYARVESTLPIEHAALAISAHINFDLAQGIHATILELGSEHDAERLARFKHDHDAVNVLLEACLPECLERLTATYSCRVTELLTGRLRPWATRRMIHTLAQWREVVWEDVLDMLAAEGGAVRELALQRMERRSRRIGYQLSRMNALNLVVRILHPLEPLWGHSHPHGGTVRDVAAGGADSASWTN
jgi:hypothetical protein